VTVSLFPPTSSFGMYGPSHLALTEGPRFVRTGRMSRWHRVRSGVGYPDGLRVYSLWCTGSVRGEDFLSREDLADGDLVCATCDGRAVGAGQEPAGPEGRRLVFSPRDVDPPKYCPGSRVQLLTRSLPPGNVGQCLACGDLHVVRAMGGPYTPKAAVVQHPPGAALVDPCPFHAWRYLDPQDDGTVRCSCGRALTNPNGETP
jgi:hypothetical protein